MILKENLTTCAKLIKNIAKIKQMSIAYDKAKNLIHFFYNF